MLDFIFNGKPTGEMAERLREGNYDPGMFRPFLDSRRRPCVSLLTGRTAQRKDASGNFICNSDGTPIEFPERQTVFISDLVRRGNMQAVYNATTLFKNEWLAVDQAVLRAARPRLRAWADLAARNPITGFDGFSTMIYEQETLSDDGEAVVDMDMLPEERNMENQYQLQGVPLPITHAGFWMSKRRLYVTRRGGHPMDVIKAEMAGRRIAEKVEKTTIGTITGLTYGRAADYGRAPTVYGYLNFPARITKVDMVAPNGTNGPDVQASWLALRSLLYAANKFGPYMVYTSTDWDAYLDAPFTTTQASYGTLRNVLLQMPDVMDIRRLDYLPNTFTVIMVQMDPETAQAIVGMPFTTVQWEEQGGFLLKFRALTIQVPRLQADYNGRCGIAVGTTS